jgi:hypothetical protein
MGSSCVFGTSDSRRGEIGSPCGRRKTGDDRLGRRCDQVMCRGIDISIRLNFGSIPHKKRRKYVRKRSRRQQRYLLERALDEQDTSKIRFKIKQLDRHG